MHPRSQPSSTVLPPQRASEAMREVVHSRRAWASCPRVLDHDRPGPGGLEARAPRDASAPQERHRREFGQGQEVKTLPGIWLVLTSVNTGSPSCRVAPREALLDASWRASSQSIASYKASSSASPRTSSSASVVVCHSRVVASFEAGCSTRSTIIATIRSRSGERFGAMSRSSPRRRAMASSASTWPWGAERSMTKASSGRTKRWPLCARRRFSTFSGGQPVRLARFFSCTLALAPSRWPSRSRIAGRELRFGTVSIGAPATGGSWPSCGCCSCRAPSGPPCRQERLGRSFAGTYRTQRSDTGDGTCPAPRRSPRSGWREVVPCADRRGGGREGA